MHTKVYDISGTKQDFLRCCTRINNEQLADLYEKGGGEVTVEAQIKGNILNSKIVNINPYQKDPTDGQYRTTNKETFNKYKGKGAMLKIDLPTDTIETNNITKGVTIELRYQIMLRGPLVTTQTEWNNTGESNIFLEESQNEKDEKESKKEEKNSTVQSEPSEIDNEKSTNQDLKSKQGKVPEKPKRKRKTKENLQEKWKSEKMMINIKGTAAREIQEVGETIVTICYQRVQEELAIITQQENRGEKRLNYRLRKAKTRELTVQDNHTMSCYFLHGQVPILKEIPGPTPKCIQYHLKKEKRGETNVLTIVQAKASTQAEIQSFLAKTTSTRRISQKPMDPNFTIKEDESDSDGEKDQTNETNETIISDDEHDEKKENPRLNENIMENKRKRNDKKEKSNKMYKVQTNIDLTNESTDDDEITVLYDNINDRMKKNEKDDVEKDKTYGLVPIRINQANNKTQQSNPLKDLRQTYASSDDD